jgi:ADP-ribose pyrophosphatase YjhB (NUDIX family)
MLDTSGFSRRTICFPCQNGEMILGMKLEGFGVGKYNGFGGKFDSEKGDKTIEDTAIRELNEESALIANKSDLKKMAVIDFVFPANQKYNQRVHVYFLPRWMGTPKKTTEMDPKTFSMNALPYDQMWDSDKLWLPQLIDNKSFYAVFYWKEDNDTVDVYNIDYDAVLDDW